MPEYGVSVRKHIYELDYIHAVSAILVVLYHYTT